MRYIIMAGGSGKRWGNFMNRPKHLIDVGGETLLERIVRQLKERNIKDIYINSDNPSYALSGATLHEPVDNEYEIDRFYSCRDIWSDNVVFLYGDVYYTDDAVDLIVKDKSKTYGYFGRSKCDNVVGKNHAELFAIKICKPYIDKFMGVVLKIRNEVEKGTHEKGLGWHTYLEMQGLNHDISIGNLRGYLQNTELLNFTEIGDETDDFDNPEDYLDFIKRKYFNSLIIFHFTNIWFAGTYKATLALIQRLYKEANIIVTYSETCRQICYDELSVYVPVIKLTKPISCHSAILVNFGDRDDLITAKHKYKWVHSAIKTLNKVVPELRADIDEYISVSKFGKTETDYVYKTNSKIIYNEVDNRIHDLSTEYVIDNFDGLKLVSINRLSLEKGFDNMIKLAGNLKERGIPFKWYIIGDAKKPKQTKITSMFNDFDEVIFTGELANPYPYIKWADYLVAPSRRETWHLGITESLTLNTPCIVTDIEPFKEQITHGVNGYMYDINFDNLDVGEILTIPTFKHTPTSHFKGFLAMFDESGYKPFTSYKSFSIVALKAYKDKSLSRRVEKGEEIEVNILRGIELYNKHAPIKILDIK